MKESEISSECEKTIIVIEEAFKTVSEELAKKSHAEERIKIAEDLVLQIKESAKEEFEKSYRKGYTDALSKSQLSDTNPEGGPKLVYKNN